MPQFIAETLAEAATALSADVAALIEVQPNALFVAYSTDPSLLECNLPGMRAAGSKISRRALDHMQLESAQICTLRVGNREWLLLFGSRNATIDEQGFTQMEKSLTEVFELLLRKRDSEAARHAYVDQLTGLPDRWATTARLNEAIVAANRNDGRAAVLFIDLNGFKAVNDTLGHAHGDKVLNAIAACMRNALRANEFVGRIGGDEFAVVLSPLKSLQSAEHVAQRLYDEVQAVAAEWASGAVSLGIGIAFYPDHAENQEQWLHHADIAMYRAKRLQQPYCIYDADDQAERRDERRASDSDHNADMAFDRQFLLCFQPIFDVHSGRVEAVEALVRSLHPEAGLLSAANTIKAASQRQRTQQLDLWVVRKALMYAEQWRSHGIERVHVNIDDYGDETFQGLLQALGTASHPSLLAIELRSPRSGDEIEQCARFIDTIACAGATVGIDDFGSENLNLTLLEQLPIAFVKLSKSLLPSTGVSGKGIEAIVALAHVMNWDVIATRVATSDDRRLIRNAGVKYMQGFAFAQPMTAIDFQAWIEGTPRVSLAR